MGKLLSRISEEVRRQVIEMYVAEQLSKSEISRRMHLGRVTVRAILDEAGAPFLKFRTQAKHPIDAEKIICDEYLSGVSMSDLARKYSYANSTSIHKVLERHSVPIRVTRRGVSEDVRAEVVRLYVEDGLTAAQIVERVGWSTTSVYRVLDGAGVVRATTAGTIRLGNRGKVFKVTPETEEQIAREYLAGSSMKSLAKKYEFSVAGIRLLLRRHGIAGRSRGATYQEIGEVMGVEIVRRYQEGESASVLGREFGLSYSNVCRYLRAQGIDVRRWAKRGAEHPAWRGGKRITPYGYVNVILDAASPYWAMAQSNGSVMEHRLVMAEYLGRPLQPWETVHHMDGNRVNNAIENLALHIGNHGSGVRYRCEDCGSYRLEPVDLKEK